MQARRRKNVVQARSFAEMLEQTIRRYQNRAIEAAQVIEELIALAKEMREADARGEALGLSEDELAFYDALETNDSAVKVLGDETLRDDRPRAGRDRARQRHDRLDAARERPRAAAGARQAHPAQVRLSAGQAGEGDADGAGAGGGAVGGVGGGVTDDISLDQQMRQAAFLLLKRKLEIREQLTSEDLSLGFDFRGTRIPLINRQRGIFKPKEMKYLLSIRTVVPRSGARVWYDDQREAHQQIYDGDEVVDYAFMGQNAEAADNRWLREAMVNRIPVIYFLGTAPGLYQPIIPTFIAGWDAEKLKATLSFGLPGETRADPSESVAERRYALREVKTRLHQATFRAAVITAYGGRCALSGLPESRLLDAAHIAADSDERLGQPIVNNGLPLSRLHHVVIYVRTCIGIYPTQKIGGSQIGSMSVRDGPTLEALKTLNGGRLILPRRSQDYPDRERLAARYEAFRNAG